ncbi:hypothetical protein LEMLEM_LOCUS21909, partial [Lemmus lemmus]
MVREGLISTDGRSGEPRSEQPGTNKQPPYNTHPF